ncbi:MAG: hydrolase [Tardiphaga sp.]|nr:hydrolase [Tardiphaga sp.]
MTAPVKARPQLAASAIVFRDGRILLVRRAHDPGRGRWSVPGGRVEHGETLEQAVHREVAEETGLAIEIVGLAGIREVLPLHQTSGHYVVLSYAALWRGGEVVLNDEHDAAQWIAPDDLGTVATTDGLAAIVAAARTIVGV